MTETPESAVRLIQREVGERVPACSGPCQQGRMACPCPWECCIPEDDLITSTAPWMAGIGLILTALFCAACAWTYL